VVSWEGWTVAILGAVFPAAERWVEKASLELFSMFWYWLVRQKR